MNRSLHHLRRRVEQGPNLNSKNGITELLEVVVIFPVMGLIIFAMVYLCRAWYVRAAVEDATAAGSRWAATSLSGAQGCAQARRAIANVMSQYHLDPAKASFSVAFDPSSAANWGRSANAIVRVSYGTDQSKVALVGSRWGNVTVRSSLVVPVDAYNNRWTNGWEECH